MNIALLRYFNPAGAHSSARIGEDPKGVPNNLVPVVTQVAIGNLEELIIHGDDYETADGTCVRDFIHVCDLAEGHVAALSKLSSGPGLVIYNLGTGRGQSVKEVIEAFEDVSGEVLNARIGPRRPGDVPITFCDPSLAEQELGWRAKRTIVDICRDAWRWQRKIQKAISPLHRERLFRYHPCVRLQVTNSFHNIKCCASRPYTSEALRRGVPTNALCPAFIFASRK